MGERPGWADPGFVLGTLIRSTRRAPLTPEAFADVLRTKRFTNGADAEAVMQLYSKTAIALLGSVTTLFFKGLAWSPTDFRRLGEALHYCGRLVHLDIDAP